ncbi:MAG: hypothetical protein JWN17_1693, partial [Frankiales bacterium]|nr:hypothetical protein [Frankiales bacterium]
EGQAQVDALVARLVECHLPGLPGCAWQTRRVLTALAILGVLAALFLVAALATRESEALAPVSPDRADDGLPDGEVRPDDLRRVRFGLALRGYRMSEVDAVLERLARQLEDRSGALDATTSGASVEREEVLPRAEGDGTPALTETGSDGHAVGDPTGAPALVPVVVPETGVPETVPEVAVSPGPAAASPLSTVSASGTTFPDDEVGAQPGGTVPGGASPDAGGAPGARTTTGTDDHAPTTVVSLESSGTTSGSSPLAPAAEETRSATSTTPGTASAPAATSAFDWATALDLPPVSTHEDEASGDTGEQAAPTTSVLPTAADEGGPVEPATTVDRDGGTPLDPAATAAPGHSGPPEVAETPDAHRP